MTDQQPGVDNRWVPEPLVGLVLTPEETTTVTLHSDTDGDLQAVPPAPGPVRSNAAGSPRTADFTGIDDWDQFADVTSHELGRLTQRMITALVGRRDEAASAELLGLYQTLSATVGTPRRPA